MTARSLQKPEFQSQVKQADCGFFGEGPPGFLRPDQGAALHRNGLVLGLRETGPGGHSQTSPQTMIAHRATDPAGLLAHPDSRGMMPFDCETCLAMMSLNQLDLGTDGAAMPPGRAGFSVPIPHQATAQVPERHLICDGYHPYAEP